MPLEKSSSCIKLEDETEGVSLYTYTFAAGNGVGGNGTSQLLLQNNLTDDTNMFLQGLEDGTTGWTLDGLPVLFPTDGQPILHQLTVEDSEMSESELQESTPIIDTSKEVTMLQQTENENHINQNESIIVDKDEDGEEEELLTENLIENANLISSVLTENGDTESTIEIPGKGFFTVSGLLFPIEQRKNIDDSNEIFQIENDSDEATIEDSNQNSIEISELADVITAYKCKSCDYTGTDKELFLEHYREFHLNNIQLVTLQDENTSPQFENIIVKSETEAQPKYFLETDEGTYELNTQDVQNVGINGNNFENLNTNGNNKMVETIEEKYILLCSQCNKGFDSIDACKQHMIDIHKLRELPGKSETRPKIISIASNTNTNDSLVNIEVSDMEVHVDDQSESNTNGKQIIVDDPRALFEKTILKIRKTNASLPLKCRVRGCSYKFATEEIRSQHEKCHVKNETAKTNDNNGNGRTGGSNFAYKCSECGIPQKSWRSVALHLWRAHSIQTDLINCPVCNVFKATLPQLEHHMMTHGDKKAYCCSECGKFYKQASQLRNHRLIHLDKVSDKRPLWYREKECEQCHKIFSNSKSLKKHLQSVHSKLKPFICNVCGHSCARKAMLQMHLRQHTGEKPYSCDICNYRTGDHNSLRRHNMKHSGIRPYKCPHCSYTSIQSNAYKYHISIKHPGKPGVFACNICSFKSVSEENYFNHLNDHKQGVIPPTKATENVSTTTSSNDRNTKNDTSKTIYFYQDVKKEASNIIPQLQVSTNNDQRKLSVCSDNEEPCYLRYDPLSDEQCIDTGGITIPAEPECSSLLQMALLSQ